LGSGLEVRCGTVSRASRKASAVSLTPTTTMRALLMILGSEMSLRVRKKSAPGEGLRVGVGLGLGLGSGLGVGVRG